MDAGTDNRELLDRLFAEDLIDARRGRLLDEQPPPMPPGFDWDRVDGMLLGLAIGDALGNTTESMLPAKRQELYGEIRDFVPHHRYGTLGSPSDDTQMAFWTLDELLRDGRLDPERLGRRFEDEQIFGGGKAVRQALARVGSGHTPWYECGTASAGNGALMRIAPVLVPYVHSPSPELWADTALCAIVTHNDAASTSACLAFVAMLWDLLGAEEPPDPAWWGRRYVELAADIEGETGYRPRVRRFEDWSGPLWLFVKERLADAWSRDLSVREACDEWYSGAYLPETVPGVLYILTRHGADPEEAIVRAVSDTKDNDTIAAIVGAAAGALHGAAALPERWVRGLPGRTRADDDGEVQRLLAAARERWG